MHKLPEITFLGTSLAQGIYLLRVHVAVPTSVIFGRFQGGQPIPIQTDDYLYVGSALGQRGATTLAGRLLRHTTRSGDRPPHPIQSPLRTQLQERGLIPAGSVGATRPKRPFWHIDYLVDRLEAEITQIFILHTSNRIESALARTLAADQAVMPVAPGLGASDDPHATHLFQVDATPNWWHNLPQQLTQFATINRSEEPDEYATPYPR